MSATNEGTNTLDRVSAILGILNNVGLASILGYQHYQHYFGRALTKKRQSVQRQNRDTRKHTILHLLSLISMVFSAFFCIVRTVIAFDGWSNSCTASTGTAVSFWQVTKASLYLYFVIRFDVAFRESAYALSHLTLNLFYVGIFLQWIAAQFLIIILWNGGLRPPVIGQCVGLPPIGLIIFFSLWDVLCTIGLSLLFSIKLCQVHQRMMQFANNNAVVKDGLSAERIKSYDFVTTIIKVCVLSVFASITTILCTFGVSQSGVTTFIVTDTMINCWCIFLMHSNNKRVFNICCCGLCTMCCLKCFLKKEANRLGVTVQEVLVQSPRLKAMKSMSSIGNHSTDKVPTASASQLTDSNMSASVIDISTTSK